MKRKYILLLMLLSVITFAGCEKDTKSDSAVEYYPVITDGEGEKIVDQFLPIGDDYKVTYKAVYGDGTDVTDKVTVVIKDGAGNKVDAVSTAKSGLYTVVYNAATSTKLSDWTIKQTIIVYDPESDVDISGTYIVDLDKTLSQDVGGRFAPKDDKKKFLPLKDYVAFFESKGPVKITLDLVYPGVYTISDAYFGWYDQVRAYGAKYKAKGYISLGTDNSIKLLSADMSVFGGELDPFEAAYDPQTESISFAYEFGSSVNIKDGVATLVKNYVSSYTIIFDSNSGDVETPNTQVEQIVIVGRKTKLQKNTFENGELEFVGWNTKADGTGISYKDETDITGWSIVDGAKVTLYAQWKEKENSGK